MIDDDTRNGADAQGTGTTLWSDAGRTRRFLIPDAAQLPPGELELSTALGRRRLVDSDALAPYEVTREEAQAWAKAELMEVARRLKAGLKGEPPGTGRAGAAEAGGAQEAAPEGERPKSPSPGLDLLADITGTPRERLSEDYRAVGQALRAYLQDAAGTTANALSGDPGREAEARRRMRGWAETLRAHGIAARAVEAPEPPGKDSPPDGGGGRD